MSLRYSRSGVTPDYHQTAPVGHDLVPWLEPVRQQQAGDGERSAGQRADTARGVARWSMRDRHGCTGRACGRAGRHVADREVRDELLDVLGLSGERAEAAARNAARRGRR